MNLSLNQGIWCRAYIHCRALANSNGWSCSKVDWNRRLLFIYFIDFTSAYICFKWFFFRFENRAVLELASNGSRSNPHLASLFDRSLEVARPRENQIGSSAFLFPSRENDLITSHSFDFTVEAAVHPLNCMCEIKLGKLYEASGSFYWVWFHTWEVWPNRAVLSTRYGRNTNNEGFERILCMRLWWRLGIEEETRNGKIGFAHILQHAFGTLCKGSTRDPPVFPAMNTCRVIRKNLTWPLFPVIHLPVDLIHVTRKNFLCTLLCKVEKKTYRCLVTKTRFSPKHSKSELIQLVQKLCQTFSVQLQPSVN